jgi:hypothetical protein
MRTVKWGRIEKIGKSTLRTIAQLAHSPIPTPTPTGPGIKDMLRRALLIGTLCAMVAGCGTKSKTGDTVVRGQILYRGEPVSGGLVVFAPDPEHGSDGPLVTTQLQPDGSFTLTAGDGKPVAPGWYRIAVAPKAGSIESPTVQRPYPGLPAKYRNPTLSGLGGEVKPGQDNVFCFDLVDE